jgi:hypothetical protein
MEKKITTSDLRLGNWLYYTNETKFIMQVVAIGDDWVQLDFEGNDGDSFEINGNEICPIPITKEFVKHIANNVQDVEELGFMITIGGSYMEVRMEYKDNELYLIPTINCDEYNIGEPIKYVHELQNLFYALNGKELEIRREWL